MTQKEIDILYEITITIHEHSWFGKRKKPRDRDEVQKWVSHQLAENLNIYTIPSGAGWGVLCNKETFKHHWNSHDN